MDVPIGSMVISEFELAKIKNSLIQEAESRSLAAERDKRRKLSEDRVQNWGNTLEAARRKDEEELMKRRDEYEKNQKILDDKEEELRAKHRKDIIERANQLLYQESDRVKSFNSKILLSDILLEREAQIRLKHLRERQAKVRDDKFNKIQEAVRKEAEQKDRNKEVKRHEDNRKIARDQQEQLELFRKRFHRLQLVRPSMNEQEHEGDLLKKQAAEDRQKEIDDLLKSQQRAVRSQMEQAEWNERLHKMKCEEQERVNKEDEEIRKYAVQKEKSIAARKKRQEEAFREKQKIRQKLVDTQVAYLTKLKKSEDTRIAKQVKEQQQKVDDENFKKAEMRRKTVRDIDKCRKEQLDRKRKEYDFLITEGKKMQQDLRDKIRQSAENGKKKKAEQLQNEEDIQQFRRMQIKKRNLKNHDDIETLRNFALKQQLDVCDEEDRFKTYADGTIDEWGKEGRNTRPMSLFVNKKDCLLPSN
eukprot:216214_1